MGVFGVITAIGGRKGLAAKVFGRWYEVGRKGKQRPERPLRCFAAGFGWAIYTNPQHFVMIWLPSELWIPGEALYGALVRHAAGYRR